MPETSQDTYFLTQANALFKSKNPDVLNTNTLPIEGRRYVGKGSFTETRYSLAFQLPLAGNTLIAICNHISGLPLDNLDRDRDYMLSRLKLSRREDRPSIIDQHDAAYRSKWWLFECFIPDYIKALESEEKYLLGALLWSKFFPRDPRHFSHKPGMADPETHYQGDNLDKYRFDAILGLVMLRYFDPKVWPVPTEVSLPHSSATRPMRALELPLYLFLYSDQILKRKQVRKLEKMIDEAPAIETQ